MIIKFFNSGTSNASSPINYLFSKKDANGKTRDVEPELIKGNVELTRSLIDSSNFKFKYKSGVLAFSDNENPTDKQIEYAINKFEDTMCAGIKKKNRNFLWVLHKDKGNTELHFLSARSTLDNLGVVRSFNIAPPGKMHEDLQLSLQSVMNQEMGFKQVIENPFKSQISDFERKITKGYISEKSVSKNTKYKDRLVLGIQEKIENGKINNRKDLINFLKDNGYKLKREGKDYISIIPPVSQNKYPFDKNSDGSQKSLRFKGPIFSENTDYRRLLSDSKHLQTNGFRLTQQEEVQANIKLNKLTRIRDDFNDRNYNQRKPKVSRTNKFKPTVNSSTIKGKKSIIKKQIENNQPKQNKDVALNNLINLRNKNDIKENPSNSISSSVSESIGDGGVQSISLSITNITGSISAAVARLGSARTAQEKAKIQDEISALNQKLIELNRQLVEAKKKAASTPKPK